MASTAVAVSAITSNAGKFGATKSVSFGLMHVYLESVKNKPKYPWYPPPRSVLILLASARKSVLIRFSNLLVGSQLMGVGVGYLKYDAA